MNFCPNAFNSDMTDPNNLMYCREIQRTDGAACRKKRCPYCVEVEIETERTTERTAGEQGSLFLPTDQTKHNKTRP